MALHELLSKDSLADSIVYQFDKFVNQRATWVSEKEELRNFIFATDTTHTVHGDGASPWKNRTTIPKLCQIRDNLHANYIAALFPNDDWLKWEGSTSDDDLYEKKQIIQAYISNKWRHGRMDDVVSQLIYDFIDYGTPIADVEWVNESKVLPSGEMSVGFVGPMPVRISPLDIVYDITARTFEKAPKITRSLMRIGELETIIKSKPGSWEEDVLEYMKSVRSASGAVSKDDMQKATAISIDGFGNYHEYLGSGYVEVLEFEGDAYDPVTGDTLDDHIITVIDRAKVIRKEPMSAWKRGGTKVSTSWRKRPDNLMGMGPLDNLVGMQYRIDHLENAKADAMDLIVTPMFKIKGGVDEFEFRPGGEVTMGPDDDISPLSVPKDALLANSEIMTLMQWMEESAGAPKQAMGVRTPGEKTAFEVQALENAAGRIFQQKIVQFEREVLEPLLNNMLMMAVDKMDGADTIRVIDDELGISEFMSITKSDLAASGRLRPVGARHFAQRAQTIQNLSGIANSAVWPKIERHFSDKALARMVEDSFQLERFSLISDNAALFEQAAAQRISSQLQEDVATEQATPLQEDL